MCPLTTAFVVSLYSLGSFPPQGFRFATRRIADSKAWEAALEEPREVAWAAVSPHENEDHSGKEPHP